jgi:opacity protein-like surface antigen
MKFTPRLFIVVLAGLLLSSCGTTSALKGTHGEAITSTRKFSKVTVQDFQLSIKEPERGSNTAPSYFADRIASELKATARFSSVARNAKPGPNTLVITGVITKYEEGNSMLRLFIGMGAGSSFFESDVFFRDNTGTTVGKIKVDKNSWALGGGIAAAQNPTMFMNGAADKIAAEAAKLAK